MPTTNRRLLIGLLIGIFGVAFQAFGVITAMPNVMSDLQADRWYAWAFTTFLIGMVMSIVIAGRMTDRFGPARPLAVGFGLFTLGLSGAALAPHVAVLLFARFAQGLGSGAMNLSLFVLVAQLFNERERSRLMAVLAFLWVLPAFVGPAAAGWIATNWGWRWVFGVTFVPIIICALMAMEPLWHLERVVPEAQPEPVPIWAGVLLGLAVASLQLAGQDMNPYSVALAAVGVVVLVWVLLIIMPKGFARASGGLSAVVWVRALQSGTFFAAEPFLSLLFTERCGLEPTQTGLFITVGSIGWTAGSAVQSQTWFRLRRDQIITLGAVSAAFGLAIVSLFAWFNQLWYIIPGIGWTLTGFGMGLSQASTSLAVMGLSAPHRQGRNTSSLQVAEGMGNALLTALAGTVHRSLTENAGARLAFTTVFVVLCVLCVVTIWLSRRIGRIPNAVAGL